MSTAPHIVRYQDGRQFGLHRAADLTAALAFAWSKELAVITTLVDSVEKTVFVHHRKLRNQQLAGVTGK